MTQKEIQEFEKLKADRERRRAYARDYYRRMRAGEFALAQSANVNASPGTTLQFQRSETPSDTE